MEITEGLKLRADIKFHHVFFVEGYYLLDDFGKVFCRIEPSFWRNKFRVFDESGTHILTVKYSGFNRQKFIDSSGGEIAELKSFLLKSKTAILVKRGVEIGKIIEKDGIYLSNEKYVSISKERFLSGRKRNSRDAGYSFVFCKNPTPSDLLVIKGVLAVQLSWIEGRMIS